MSLHVLRAGVLDTFQDMGRQGYAKWGINPGGAMDVFAAQMANALVGNESSDPVIELHFPAMQLQFEEEALISLTGADFSASIGSETLPLWKPLIIPKNSVLSFQKRLHGHRCYFTVHGGFDLPSWLGSASTNLKISAGGIDGRALKKNDILKLRKPKFFLKSKNSSLSWSINAHPVYQNHHDIFFIEGPDWNCLTKESQKKIEGESFSIDSISDRMAYYLKHEPLEFQSEHSVISSGVTFGTMQCLPSGQLLILMADHQTTGGYPRIGNIISSHFPKLAQLGAHQNFSLHKIKIEEAEKMLLSLQQQIQSMIRSCHDKLHHHVQY